MPLCCPDNSETLSGCYRKQCPDVTEILGASFSLITFQDTETDRQTIMEKINSEINKIKSSLSIKTDINLFSYAFKKKNK
jgi:hypothetical protein